MAVLGIVLRTVPCAVVLGIVLAVVLGTVLVVVLRIVLAVSAVSAVIHDILPPFTLLLRHALWLIPYTRMRRIQHLMLRR